LTAPGEYSQLFLGSASTQTSGRYGTATAPVAPWGKTASAGISTHAYAPLDVDGANEMSNGSASSPLALPKGTQGFPAISAGWASGSNAELMNNPLLYNVFLAVTGMPINPPTTTSSDDTAVRRYLAQIAVRGMHLPLSSTSRMCQTPPSRCSAILARRCITIRTRTGRWCVFCVCFTDSHQFCNNGLMAGR
jgi:hypothetical protein